MELNSLLEVYIDYLSLKCKDLIIDEIGHCGHENLLFYIVLNKNTNKFVMFGSFPQEFFNKRIKKDITRYRRSLFMAYPLNAENQIMSKKNFDKLIVDFEGGKITDEEYYITDDIHKLLDYLIIDL